MHTKKLTLDKAEISKYQFYLDEHIGGRYSVTSVMGTVINLCLGKNHKRFLTGAYEQDQMQEKDIQKKFLIAA